MSEARVVAVGAPPTFRHQVARALEVEPDRVEWVPTVAAAEEAVGVGPRPSVVAISPQVKEPDAFGMSEYVGQASPATMVVLVRDVSKNGLFPGAMKAGIREVVDLSQGGEELRDALRRAIAWSERLRATHGDEERAGPDVRGAVISVFSSKGGSGKTMLATNLAAAIARQTDADTALLDLEFEMGDAFAYFGREPTGLLQDLKEVGERTDRKEIVEAGTELDRHLRGYGTAPEHDAASKVTGEAVGKVVRALRRTFAHTVVDATDQYSDPALAAMDLSDAICVIAGLDVVGVRHLSASVRTLLDLGYPRERFRLVLNRADSKVGLSMADVEKAMKVKPDAAIPSSKLVPASLNVGRPVVVTQPRSDVARAINALARSLVESLGERRARGAEPTEPPAEVFAGGPAPRRAGLFARR